MAGASRRASPGPPSHILRQPIIFSMGRDKSVFCALILCARTVARDEGFCRRRARANTPPRTAHRPTDTTDYGFTLAFIYFNLSYYVRRIVWTVGFITHICAADEIIAS